MSVDRRDFIRGVAAGALGAGIAGLTGRSLLAEEEKPVKTRTLGRTGIQCSVVTFGCGGMSSGKIKMLEAAVDRGINVLDTAWGYGGGESERAIGAFLAGRKDREKIFVLTKASGFRPTGTAKEVYAALKTSVEESLKRLQTEYIDIFMCPHGASARSQLEIETVREALTRLRKEDKLIRWIGTSSHSNYAETCEAAIEGGFYDVLMPVANVATQNAEKAKMPEAGRRGRPPAKPLDTRKMFEMAKKKNVGIIVMKAAQRGYTPENAEDLLKGAFPADSTFSLHQRLYGYVLKQEGCSSVTVGIGDTTHLKEAIELAHGV